MDFSTTERDNLKAWIYIAKEDELKPGLQPYEWYKRFLVEGAIENGLPSQYIVNLKAIPAINDPNSLRDEEKRKLTRP